MYKFDTISNLNEMKELCFYIRAINEAIEEDKFNKKDLMPLKYFIENRYNLEISLSKLYLFVEKIFYVNGTKNKFPSIDDLDKIIKAYIEYHRDKLKAAEIEVLKQELKLKDAKYKVNKREYSSAEDLATNISVNKKLYNSNNNWLILISVVAALFVVSAITVAIGSFFPNIFKLYVTKGQELALTFLAFLILSGLFYVISLHTYAKSTNRLRKKIGSYNHYSSQIENDYANYNNARLVHNSISKEFCISGIEFSEKIIYNYLNQNDKMDIILYGTQLKKGETAVNRTLPKGTSKLGIVLSRNEQNYNWQNSKISLIEKKNINKELVTEVNTLASKLKSKNQSSNELAKEISDFYCGELSVEKRQKEIDGATSKIELASHYIKYMDRIIHFKDHNIFEGTDIKSLRKINLIEEAEMLSFKEFLTAMCDRIEKAGILKLIPQGQFETYKVIKSELGSGIIYGVNINEINTRYDLNKLFIKIYNELSILDTLN